ncbi:hypothetical protein FQN54_005530 [Arachnomyces sp. PD_36]|nr:hypothetical protein FQN54_005530 [Arachnomyces sp. PD_36]
MALNRVTSLEECEHRKPKSNRPPPIEYDEAAPSLGRSPNTSNLHLLSASPPSQATRHSVGERLSFNPAAGPSWNQREADGEWSFIEEETASLPGDGSDADDEDSVRALAGPIPRPDTAFHQSAPGFGQATGAFEVGKGKRIAQVAAAVIYCFLSAGIVFGFAALKPILIQEGAFREQCDGDEPDSIYMPCYKQEIRLNLMFTIAATATNMCALPVGAILDAYGPRISSMIGCLWLLLGALLLAFATSIPFDSYTPGYLFLGVGGSFMFVPVFQLSNTFPAHSGMILSMLTGAFDSSTILFLLFRLMNEHTDGYISIRRFFLFYLIVPILILLLQLFLMPGTSYKTVGELVQQAEEAIADETNDTTEDDILNTSEREQRRKYRRERRESVVSEIQNLLDDGTNNCKARTLALDLNKPHAAQANATTETHSKMDKIRSSGGAWGAMHGASALEQIRSPWFILVALVTAIQMLRVNYFIATIREQYTYLLSSPTLTDQVTHTFDILLPLSGLIAIPFIGAVLDYTTTTTTLFLIVTLATLIGILGCIPNNLPIAYIHIILFTLYRPFYYTTISDYTATVFGFRTFGKVYGLITCLSGLGNFAQAGLDTLTIKVFGRNPIPVNVVLTLDGFLVGAGLVVFVWWKGRIWGREWWKGDDEERRGGGNGTGVGVGAGAPVAPATEREALLRRGPNGDVNGEYGSVR